MAFTMNIDILATDISFMEDTIWISDLLWYFWGSALLLYSALIGAQRVDRSHKFNQIYVQNAIFVSKLIDFDVFKHLQSSKETRNGYSR